MMAFFGFVGIIAFLTCIVSIVMYFVARVKHSQPKRRKWRHIMLGSIAVMFLIGLGAGVTGRTDAGGDSHHADRAQIRKEYRATEHKKAVAKAKAKQKKQLKKAQLRNEKHNLADLKAALKTFPARSHGSFTDARIDPGEKSVTVTISDDALAGSDAQTKQNVHEAWKAAVVWVQKYAPYPDNTIDGDEPLVYVQDNSGDLLGETSGWTGQFKYKG